MNGANGTLFDTGAATHVGKVRKQNEDNFIIRPEIGLWCVADGMGGHEAGGLASAAVVEALRALEPPATPAGLLAACEQAMIGANSGIRSIASARGFEVIGTTVVILLMADGYFACLWSGDSRIYRVRAGGIAQITRDHSEAQELIDQGLLSEADAKTFARRNVITRAIGVFENAELDLQHGELEPGDVFVLCSDGLTAHVEAGEIPPRVMKTKAQDACAELVRLTLERGAQDNVTVVVVGYKQDGDTLVIPEGAGNGARG